MAKILIAEDEPNVRETLVEIVKGAGHEVAEAFDGLAALDEIKAFRPDIVLLDWMIPELFGGEVLAKLRSHEDFESVRDTVVIVVSDFVSENENNTFVSSGANGFVAKDDDVERLRRNLLDTINAHLGTES